MTDNISNGMAFTVSSWKPPSARWLQGDRCEEECAWPVKTVFSNLEFWTYGGNSPEPKIEYGRTCGKLRAG